MYICIYAYVCMCTVREHTRLCAANVDTLSGDVAAFGARSFRASTQYLSCYICYHSALMLPACSKSVFSAFVNLACASHQSCNTFPLENFNENAAHGEDATLHSSVFSCACKFCSWLCDVWHSIPICKSRMEIDKKQKCDIIFVRGP